MVSQDRHKIYYWKCDRAAAFHGTDAIRPDSPHLAAQLTAALERRFPGKTLALRDGGGQGNHRIFRLTIAPQAQAHNAAGAAEIDAIVRIEDGPERDNYFDVEAVVLAQLRTLGLPVSRLLASDCTRTETSFAWQVLEYIPYSDLNTFFKAGTLAIAPVFSDIGAAVARWQEVKPPGFGPFSATTARAENRLVGLHNSYRSYFTLNLQRHLDFLTAQQFLSGSESAAIVRQIAAHEARLDLSQGCLVHKDLALWNCLGSAERALAFIDWDDVISGDPLDDLSLLGCFHDRSAVGHAFAGYTSVRPLPAAALPRFWLHLLRNMLFKAVIRVGAGYFKRSDSFFLIGTGGSGATLEEFTRARIATALAGLTHDRDLDILQ